MTERVVQFGQAADLVGVLTEARNPGADAPGIVLMNSGLVHRVGPNRMYVELARELAAAGYSVLRMDFSGVGDSSARRDHLPYEQSSALEAREGMDQLQQLLGLRRFVLMGICSGAEASLHIALSDPRVVGIVPIEFYGYENLWFQLQIYRRRLLSLRSWRRLISGRSDVFALLRSRLRGASEEARNTAPPTVGGTPSLPVKQKRALVVDAFRAIGERGVRVCLVYGAGASYFNYRTLFRRPLRKLVASGLIEVEYVGASDHTFTLRENQQQLRAAILDWVRRSFQTNRPKLERRAGAPAQTSEPRTEDRDGDSEVPSTHRTPAPDRVALSANARQQVFDRLLRERGLSSASQRLTIPPRPEGSARAPLSYNQEGLWFLDRLHPTGAHYSLPAAIRLDGALDRTAIERAVIEVWKRHESLRTRFALNAQGEPEQVSDGPVPSELPFEDFSGNRRAEADKLVLEWIRRESRRPFDLETGPVFRTALVRLAEDAHVLWLNIHHIVSDGWSVSIIARELLTLYRCFARGEASPLPKPSRQFGDFAAWERGPARAEGRQRKLSFWTRHLEGAPDRSPLTSDHPRPQVPTLQGAHLGFEFPAETAVRVRHLARHEQLTPVAILQTVFRVLLYHWSGESDTVVGCALANRVYRELHDVVGYFVNTMPLRVVLDPERSVRQAFAQVQRLMLTTAENQSLPFPKLVQTLRPDREAGGQPLFQVVFDVLTPEHNPAFIGYGLGSCPRHSHDIGALRLSPFAFDNGSSRFDLAIFLWVRPDSIQGTVEFSTDLFATATIRSLIARLQSLAQELTSDLDTRLGRVIDRFGQRLREQQQERSRAHRQEHSRKLRGVKRRPVRVQSGNMGADS